MKSNELQDLNNKLDAAKTAEALAKTAHDTVAEEATKAKAAVDAFNPAKELEADRITKIEDETEKKTAQEKFATDFSKEAEDKLVQVEKAATEAVQKAQTAYITAQTAVTEAQTAVTTQETAEKAAADKAATDKAAADKAATDKAAADKAAADKAAADKAAADKAAYDELSDEDKKKFDADKKAADVKKAAEEAKKLEDSNKAIAATDAKHQRWLNVLKATHKILKERIEKAKASKDVKTPEMIKYIDELEIQDKNLTSEIAKFEFILDSHKKTSDAAEKAAKEILARAAFKDFTKTFKSIGNELEDMATHINSVNVEFLEDKKSDLTKLEKELKDTKYDKSTQIYKDLVKQVEDLKNVIKEVEDEIKAHVPVKTPSTPSTDDKSILSSLNDAADYVFHHKNKTYGSILQEAAFIGIGVLGCVVFVKAAVGLNVLSTMNPNSVGYQILNHSATYVAGGIGVFAGAKVLNDNAGKVLATVATVATCAMFSYHLNNHVPSILAAGAVIANMAISTSEKGTMYEGFKQTVSSTIGYSM